MNREKLLGALTILSTFLLLEMNVLAEAKLEPEDSSIIENDYYDTYDKIIVAKNGAGYTSIQEAINVSSIGSTIYVKEGTYNEIITINKEINLIGEDRETTIIKSESKKNGYAVKITSSGVKISGFSIQNEGPGLYTTGIKIIASQATIEYCNIFDTPVGIAVWSSKNTISNCTFWGCEDEGIAFLGTVNSNCNNNLVTNCEFYDNCDGIELQYSSNNVISHCTFYNNTHAGIDAIGSSNNNNEISSCNLYDNDVFDIYLSRSSGNNIARCSFSENKIKMTPSAGNTITECNLDVFYSINGSSSILNGSDNPIESFIRTITSMYEKYDGDAEYGKVIPDGNIRMRLINKVITLLTNIQLRLKTFFSNT